MSSQKMPPLLRYLLTGFFLLASLSLANAQNSFTVKKVGGSTCAGGTVTFAVIGPAEVNYWFVTGGHYTIVSGGGTSNWISVRWDTPQRAGVVANATNGSASAYVYITDAVTPSVTISANKSTACEGDNVSFTASAANGGGSPQYTWYVNGEPITGASSKTFSTAALEPGSNSIYVRMFSTASCVTKREDNSNTVTVNVTEPEHMTVSISGTTTVCEGSGANFSARVSNAVGTLTYRWRKNGIPVTSDVTGPPPYALVLNSINNNDVITCSVSTNASCYSGAISNTLTVTTSPKQVFYTGFSPNGITFCQGEEVTFTASTGTHPASSYRWKINGYEVPNENASTFTTTADYVEDLKSVQLITTTSGNCVKNSVATVSAADIPFTINPKPSAPVVQQPFYIAYNTATDLMASGASSNEIYRWYSAPTGGQPLASTTTPKLTASRTYYVTKYNTQTGCEGNPRKKFTITVNKLPAVSAGPDKTIELPTNEVTLEGSATDPDGSIASLTWRKVSGPAATVPSGAGATVTVSELVAGTYIFEVTATDNRGFLASDRVTVTVTYPPNNYNYIETTTILVGGITETDQLGPLTVSQKNISTTYYDGLGRPMQQVGWQGSPKGFDMVQPIVYDAFGRESKKYLPFAHSAKDGWYKPNEGIIDTETGLYIGKAADFYAPGTDNKVAGDPRPFSETVFEPSPLNRPSETYGPGQDWYDNGKRIQHGYLTNIHGTGEGEEEIIAWALGTSGMPERMGLIDGHVVAGGYYASGQLYVKGTLDEHQNAVREYSNKLGQVILKKVQLAKNNPVLNNREHWAQTYYLYDDFGNLRFVLQPELVFDIMENDNSNPSQIALDSLAFQYKYDERNRMAEKKVPGGGWVYMAYDDRDRLVLTQDGNQREEGQWSFTKYDALNRPVLTGTYENDATTQQAMQTAVDQFYEAVENNPGNTDEWFEERGPGPHGYTNNSFPKAGIAEYLTITYYDNYTFRDGLSEFGNAFNFDGGQLSCKTTARGEYCFPDAENTRVKGQVTGTKVKVLDPDQEQWIKTVNYYDDKYRLIQAVTENHFSKTDRFSSLYDFTGQLLTTVLVHNSHTETDLKTYKEYVYDHAGRLLETYQQIGDDPADKVLLAKNEYNELGELVKKNLHKEVDGTFAQSVDYRYNIRGWLTRINNSDLSPDTGDTKEDLFGMGLFYNFGFDVPQYNGNISGVRWKSKVDEVERAYGYTYDPMNRLTGADYIAGGTGNWTQEADRYEVGNLEYDLNGNILRLHRNGLFRHLPLEEAEYGITDQLKYKYKGNQLVAVNDAITTPEATRNDFKDNGSKGDHDSAEYGYDENGNMTRDANKGIDIAYNYLNLPKKVDFGDGKHIEYTYDASGIKLYQKVVDGENPEKRTDYIAGMVYENGQLQFVRHEEGRAMMVDSEGQDILPEYQYHLKDHLGNVRLTFTTKPELYESNASIEPDLADGERAGFINYDKVTKINSDLFNHTEGADSHYSIRLSGTEGEKIGLAKSLAVMTGDTIRAEVFGKYLDPEQSNYDQLVQNIIATVATGGAMGTGTEAGTSTGGEGAFPFGGLLNKTGGDQGVMAYLNYLVFDKEGVLNEGQSGYVALSTDAREDGTGRPHEKLSKEIVVTEPGFVYIYLSNDNPEPLDVVFDDFGVEQVHSAIVQADDYYPFGLSFNSYKRENLIFNNFLFNGGSELQGLLNWYQTQNRMYVPTLGRFHGIDALADLMPTMSPMAYAYNNPILFYDPLGLSGIPGCKECPAGVVMEEVTITAPNMSTPDSFSMLNNLSWNSNPVYRNIGVQFDKGNFEYLNRAFNQPFIHYGEGLGGETEWMREFNMAYGTFLNVGVSGTLVVAFASPLVAELLISGGSAGALTTEAIATRVGIEVISQTAVNMATFGIEGISRLDVADVAISASGLNYVAGSTFGATVDWEPFNNNKLTGWGFGKNSGDVVTDFSVGLFAGGQSNALNSLNANKTLIKVFDLWNTTKANGLGAVVQENTK